MLGIDYDTDTCVVEMGANHAGRNLRDWLRSPTPTSAGPQGRSRHVGEFGESTPYQRAKSEMVTDLRADAVALLNADDDRVCGDGGRDRGDGALVWAVGHCGRAREDHRGTSDGHARHFVVGDSRMPVRLRILGEHHVQNALAASPGRSRARPDLAAAVAAIEAVARAERWRMELLLPPSGAIVINDAYNASPDSMAAALKTLAQVRGENDRTIAVLGEMAELGSTPTRSTTGSVRLVVRLNIRKLIVVGHAARHIHNAAGLEGSWDGESVFVETPDEAYDLLREDLGTGDIVLVKSSKSANLRFLRRPARRGSARSVCGMIGLLVGAGFSLAFTLFPDSRVSPAWPSD